MNKCTIPIFVIIILVIVGCLFYKKKPVKEGFKPMPGKHQMKVLDEWNKNAASYLCNKETDDSEERKLSTFVAFCKRMIDIRIILHIQMSS